MGEERGFHQECCTTDISEPVRPVDESAIFVTRFTHLPWSARRESLRHTVRTVAISSLCLPRGERLRRPGAPEKRAYSDRLSLLLLIGGSNRLSTGVF